MSEDSGGQIESPDELTGKLLSVLESTIDDQKSELVQMRIVGNINSDAACTEPDWEDLTFPMQEDLASMRLAVAGHVLWHACGSLG